MKKFFLKKVIATVLATTMIIGNVQAFAYNAATPKQNINNDGWKLVWNDEFDGTELDTGKWSYQTGNGYQGWGNREEQYYTKDNVSVQDGTLRITAKKENKNGCAYTSGRIRTVTNDGEKLFTAKYGRFEARMKLPKGQGLWPAFWMMPADSVYGRWPLSGEIDIMEARGRVLNQVSGTIHFGEVDNNKKSLGGKYIFDAQEDITGFHTYAVEWNENNIIWYVDGNEYYRASNWYTMDANGKISNYPAPFDQEFYLILNLAVGGNYDNYVTPNDSDLPNELEVDYVRVYQKETGYATENIQMPEGERDCVGYRQVVKYEDRNLLNNLGTVNETMMDRNATKIEDGKWYFLNNRSYGGAATLSKTNYEGDPFVNVAITDGGSGAYAVQLEHMVTFSKGYLYKIRFDAMSLNGDRQIAMKLMNGAYKNYTSSYRPVITNEMKTYEISFMMSEESDSKSRIEFNLGGATGNLMIGNIQIVAIDNDCYEEERRPSVVTDEIEPVTENVAEENVTDENVAENVAENVTEEAEHSEHPTVSTEINTSNDPTVSKEQNEDETAAVEEAVAQEEETTEESVEDVVQEETTEIEEMETVTTEENVTEENETVTNEENVTEENETVIDEERVAEESVTSNDSTVSSEGNTTNDVAQENESKQVYEKADLSLGVYINYLWNFFQFKPRLINVWSEPVATVEKGKTYTISFRVKANAENKTFGVGITDRYGHSVSGTKTIGTEWKDFSFDIVAGGSGDWNLEYYLLSNSGNYSITIEQILITER